MRRLLLSFSFLFLAAPSMAESSGDQDMASTAPDQGAEAGITERPAEDNANADSYRFGNLSTGIMDNTNPVEASRRTRRSSQGTKGND